MRLRFSSATLLLFGGWSLLAGTALADDSGDNDGEELRPNFAAPRPWHEEGTFKHTSKYYNFPTYHELNDTALSYAAKCLADFCESNTFVAKKSGKIRCSVPGEVQGEKTVAYLCNFSNFNTRCSAPMVANSLLRLRESGSKTGYVNISGGKGHEMRFGYETHCGGGGKCGAHYDPVSSTCDYYSGDFRAAGYQYDQVIIPRPIVAEQDFEFKGNEWAEDPTPAAKNTIAYPTVNPAIATAAD
ncbi:hypothetical protein B0T17DRAFT_621008 [Bombardia bombarda]|uniref:Uncharacterized protein n=1 Tax=Bombardia bombarda TaxID=252184 RepID=A0AA39TGW3_9PEZI|nr:hypothetical protein B0T17DRAFT_621008 [Bombardia bombarda]